MSPNLAGTRNPGHGTTSTYIIAVMRSYFWVLLAFVSIHDVTASPVNTRGGSKEKISHRDKRAILGNVCDGSIVEYPVSQGELAPANYPDAYQIGTCRWRIIVPQGQTISVTFTLVSIACYSGDYLFITDGPSPSSPILLFTCGTAYNNFQTFGNSMYVEFFSVRGHRYRQGFHLSYSASGSGESTPPPTPSPGGTPAPTLSPGGDPCSAGGVQLTEGGVQVIRSPGFQDNEGGFYPPIATCTWQINAPANKHILLEFESFNVEYHSTCNYDYLKVYNSATTSASNQLHILCGRNIPLPVKSTTNTVLLYFHSDSSVQLNGFKINYRFLDFETSNAPEEAGCDGSQKMLTAASGTISSPAYDGVALYPGGSECVYHIIAGTGAQIQLTMLDFGLEDGDGCPYDHVVIYDGPTISNSNILAGPLCGHSDNIIIPESVTNEVIVAFESDETISKKGFSITYTSTGGNGGNGGNGGTGDLDPCDKSAVILSERTGEIQYPVSGNYPNGQLCKWAVRAAPGEQIIFTWSLLSIEQHSSCNYDSVSLYDGNSEAFKNFGPYCSGIPGETKTSGHEALVVFKSDGSVTAQGFRTSYLIASAGATNSASFPGCNGVTVTSSGLSGVISSPNYDGISAEYPGMANCDYQISVATGAGIEIEFTHFSLEDGGQCEYDYVQITEGAANDPVFRGCGQRGTFSLSISNNQATVRFVSDSSMQGTGFSLTWKQITPQSTTCSQNVIPIDPYTATQNRILGGTEATPHSLPWQILLVQNGNFICGGSIISEYWVLTAAHCTLGRSGLSILAGTHRPFDTTEGTEQYIQVSQVTEYPGYTSEGLDVDYSLLRLITPLTWSTSVQPVCLADKDYPVGGAPCLASGWGDTSYPGGSPSYTLQQIYLHVYSRTDCVQAFPGTITDYMLCAGSGEPGKDPCFGDSGGPLICMQDGVWQLHGVVSFGAGCGDARYPGVFARVSVVIDWIQRVTSNAGQTV